MCESDQRSGWNREFGSWLKKAMQSCRTSRTPQSSPVESTEMSGSMSTFVVKWHLFVPPIQGVPGTSRTQTGSSLPLRWSWWKWLNGWTGNFCLLCFSYTSVDIRRMPTTRWAPVPAALPMLFQCHSCHQCTSRFNKEGNWEKQRLHGLTYRWALKKS